MCDRRVTLAKLAQHSCLGVERRKTEPLNEPDSEASGVCSHHCGYSTLLNTANGHNCVRKPAQCIEDESVENQSIFSQSGMASLTQSAIAKMKSW